MKIFLKKNKCANISNILCRQLSDFGDKMFFKILVKFYLFATGRGQQAQQGSIFNDPHEQNIRTLTKILKTRYKKLYSNYF